MIFCGKPLAHSYHLFLKDPELFILVLYECNTHRVTAPALTFNGRRGKVVLGRMGQVTFSVEGITFSKGPQFSSL